MVKTLKVSREAAQIALAYDRLIAVLDVPVEALERVIVRCRAAKERFDLRRQDRRERREHRRLQERIWSGVIRKVGGAW